MRKVLILASGGLDSTVLIYLYKRLKYDIEVVFFDYGAVGNSLEIDKLKKLCAKLNITDNHIHIIPINLNWTNAKNMDNNNVYVEMRNLIFLSNAISLAESLKINKVAIGLITNTHYYPDSTPDFINQMDDLAINSLGISVEAPLMNLEKQDVYLLGKDLGASLKETTSCFSPTVNGEVCGECVGCRDVKEIIKMGVVPDEDNPFI